MKIELRVWDILVAIVLVILVVLLASYHAKLSKYDSLMSIQNIVSQLNQNTKDIQQIASWVARHEAETQVPKQLEKK